MALVHKKEVGKQQAVKILRETDLKLAFVAGRPCEVHVALRYTQCFKTKASSAPVPGLLTVQ